MQYYRDFSSNCASSARLLSIHETAELYDSSNMAILDKLTPVWTKRFKSDHRMLDSTMTHEWRRHLRHLDRWLLLGLTHAVGALNRHQLRTLGVVRRHHWRWNIATVHLVALLCCNMSQKQIHLLDLLISKAYQCVVYTSHFYFIYGHTIRNKLLSATRGNYSPCATATYMAVVGPAVLTVPLAPAPPPPSIMACSCSMAIASASAYVMTFKLSGFTHADSLVRAL